MHFKTLCSALIVLFPSVLVLGLPTELGVQQSADIIVHDGNESVPCSQIGCWDGFATLSNATGYCICPRWKKQDLTTPCGFLKCPNTTKLYYDSVFNRCLCEPKYGLPWLIHQATDRIAEHNARVYSVQPYFLDDVISFHVQLAGAPDGFNLNASTTIAASSIGTDPAPNLVLMPTNMKTRVSTAAEETALIVAVTFEPGDSITYHVQISNGTVFKLHGDKYVHDIDLIDPSAPPSLSILTSQSLSYVKRDAWFQDAGADPSIRPAPLTTTKRGIAGLSSSITLSEETCRSITCSNDGSERPYFNPYLKTCYCKKLDPPNNSFDSFLKRSVSDQSGVLRKPTPEACRRMANTCQGKTEPYLDETTGQCYCVVYRTGIKEPVIVSNTNYWPRAEHVVSQEEESGNSGSLDEAPTCAESHKMDPCPTQLGCHVGYCPDRICGTCILPLNLTAAHAPGAKLRFLPGHSDNYSSTMVTARELVDSLDRRYKHNWGEDVKYLNQNNLVTEKNVRLLENRYLNARNAYREKFNEILAANRRKPQADDKWILDILKGRLDNMEWVRGAIHNLWTAVGAQNAARRRH
ncbi:hypothetical protein EPUS_05352 [Endocarpon pusillum Z07020]|uniref:Uncharacterized protein n=1 Tax=Endocarpon pusillum (strain Z07020 / HMAS-L-300199) TaxID=1263415 RepID=U1HWY3_ENDPU|nr:uncharacterized protein EPUS_05352 [Endocarpon pusillum Z07020]ERF73929.1 hypothetical protein EPUS_05352 [Endocarpon pusillum Z07020]